MKVVDVLRTVIMMMFAFTLLSSPSLAVVETTSSTTISLDVYEICINADESVTNVGYLINGNPSTSQLFVVKDEEVLITLISLPDGKLLRTSIDGNAAEELSPDSVRIYNIDSNRVVVSLFLENNPMYIPPSVSHPVISPELDDPIIPDIPGTDEPTNPDTPGYDEPGSDEPYTPILPPAGIVYNIAGFASLAAGLLLLFLLFFMRGNLVYRTLKKHAKEHGEKPDKEEKKHLKEIASAVVSRIRDDEKYPEWKKNSDVMKHLGVDICLLLDEMKYREAVPREALVTEILEKARGKINRHRL